MAGQKFTSWVHGSAMTGEYLNRVTSVRHCGPFARIEGNEGQNAWMHFAIPTPTVQNGNRTKAESVSVSFRARSHANVAEVLVYDGEKIIAEHLGMAIKGDNLDASFEIPGCSRGGPGHQRGGGRNLRRRGAGHPLHAGGDRGRGRGLRRLARAAN